MRTTPNQDYTDKMKKNLLDMITNSGVVGVSQKEIHQQMKIDKSVRYELLNQLRNEGKIYYHNSSMKWRLAEYKTRHEKLSSLEWSAS